MPLIRKAFKSSTERSGNTKQEPPKIHDLTRVVKETTKRRMRRSPSSQGRGGNTQQEPTTSGSSQRWGGDTQKEPTRSGSSHGRGGDTQQERTKSLSSQGRGGDTQQEPTMSGSSQRRGGDTQQEPHLLCIAENIADSLAIDRALEEACIKYYGHIAERKVVRIIKDYISNDISGILRSDIRRRERNLRSGKHHGFSKFIEGKVLISKKKILVEQQGTPNGTPESSEDEDEEDGPEIPLEMLESFDVKALMDDAATPLCTRNKESLSKGLDGFQSATPAESEEKNERDDSLSVGGGKGNVAAKDDVRHCVLHVGRAAKKILVEQRGSPTGTPESSEDEDEDEEDGPEIPIEMLESFNVKDLSDYTAKPLLKRNKESLDKGLDSFQSATLAESEDKNERDDSLSVGGTIGKVVEKDDLMHCVFHVGRGASVIATATPAEGEDVAETEKILQAGGESREITPKPEDDAERHNLLHVGQGVREFRTATPAESEDEDGSEETLQAEGKPREVAPKVIPFVPPIETDRGNINDNAEVPYGLVNNGNKCYLNSIVQSLFACKLFRANLLQKLDPRVTTKKFKDELSEELAILFQMMLTTVFEPVKLFKTLCSIESCSEFADGSQQDCFDVLVKIMEHWSDKKDEGIVKLFCGQNVTKVTCTECQTTNFKLDPFMVLKLNLSGPNSLPFYPTPTIGELIEDRAGAEVLDGENKYDCSDCQDYTKAIKTLDLHEAPPILVILIKRFKRTADLTTAIKLQKFVKYEEKLELSVDCLDGVKEQKWYNLKSVITHIGNTPSSGGHYTAVTKHELQNSKWIFYDDENRVLISTNEALSQQAYLLFYELEDQEVPPLINDPESFDYEDSTAQYEYKEEDDSDSSRPAEGVEIEVRAGATEDALTVETSIPSLIHPVLSHHDATSFLLEDSVEDQGEPTVIDDPEPFDYEDIKAQHDSKDEDDNEESWPAEGVEREVWPGATEAELTVETAIPSLINPESSHHDANSSLVEDSVVDVSDEPQINEVKNDNERSRASVNTGLPQVDELIKSKGSGGVVLHDKSKLICCSVCRCIIAESMKFNHSKEKKHKKKKEPRPEWYIVTKECELCNWSTQSRNCEKEYQEHVNGKHHRRMVKWKECGGALTVI